MAPTARRAVHDSIATTAVIRHSVSDEINAVECADKVKYRKTLTTMKTATADLSK